MLYLRNTNQQQSLGKDIQRGITNTCCTPTLNSVTSASFSQLTINSTFGTYLVNCKSCVGGYIQVSENYGSTWTTINPGNCSTTNLVPMPSQSAFYRVFTSCSAVDQPFDPLTSSFSNEIFYVPNSRLNYTFVDEEGASANFKLIVTGSTILDTTSSVSGLQFIPSASAVSASIGSISVPYTGSTSMSLLITGSNVNYFTSSCVTNSGSIFIGSYRANPNQDYYLTASINHLPGRQAVCGTNTLDYTVDSCDIPNKIWYPSNAEGTFTSASTNFGFITGSVGRSNIETGDCRFNAIQFSGSATFNLPTPGAGNLPTIYLAVVSGSFMISGSAGAGNDWNMTVTNNANNTGSVVLGGSGIMSYTLNSTDIRNNIVLLEVNTGTSPFGRRELSLYLGGTLVSNNPPTSEIGFPLSLGSTFTLSGVGVLRAFGQAEGFPTTYAQSQTYYDCLYQVT